MTNDIDRLEEIIPGLSSAVYEKFRHFFTLVEHYNSKINLIAKSTLARAAIKHFSDSVQGLEIIQPELFDGEPVLDFGSGNGFPGIISGILFSDREHVLVERDQRKAEFLKTAVHNLKLKNVDVHAGGVSEISDGTCFNVISRAMAPIPKFLLESRAPMAVGGKAFLFKSEHWSTEFSVVPPQIFEYWEVDLLGKYVLESNEGKRFIVCCTRV